MNAEVKLTTIDKLYYHKELTKRGFNEQIIKDIFEMYTIESIKNIIERDPKLYDLDFVRELQKMGKDPNRRTRLHTEMEAKKQNIERVKEKYAEEKSIQDEEDNDIDIGDVPF
jgi:hypothetical protein